MFRTPQYLERTTYIRVDLDTALTFPGNNNPQKKFGYKFSLKDRDSFYDWYDAYFRVDFDLEATANGADIAEDTRSAPINGSFSLIKSLVVKSSGKKLYEADNINKVVFIKNLLDFSDDFSRSVAKTIFGILIMLMTLWLQKPLRRTLECGQGRFYQTKAKQFIPLSL